MTARASRRWLLRLLAAAIPGAALARLPLRFAQAQADLAASVRIYESTTVHNSYPDDCDARLGSLYIAEDLELTIEVHLSRDLSEAEAQQVQWVISNDAADPSSGDFSGASNPAVIKTTVTAGARRDGADALVHVTLQGTDLTEPLPMRVVSNTEYDAALATLLAFTETSNRSRSQLPLTSDLLSRFLGKESTLVGVPSLSTTPLNICDPRLTHRAGASWGADSETDVPLVSYPADQRASSIVAQGVAFALLSQYAAEIRQAISTTGQQTVAYQHDGNLTLDVPLDALFALHGVQFDGTLSATIAPVEASQPLVARDVHVTGQVSDLYDFSMDAFGAGALPAAEAAKVQIASVKHDIGKVFIVSFDLDTTLETVEFDRRA